MATSTIKAGYNRVFINGCHSGLARSDGRINITIPYQSGAKPTSISISSNTLQGTIYGDKAAIPCTFEPQNLSCDDGSIYMNLSPSITLSNYQTLAKSVLVVISGTVTVSLN